MKRSIAFIHDTRGILAIEFALFVMIFVSFSWITAEVCRAYRIENTVHRATATLADIMANQALNQGEELIDTLPAMMLPARLLFEQMVASDNPDIEVGLVMNFYSPVFATVPERSLVLKVGSPCPVQDIEPLKAQVALGMVTADNFAQLELVRIEACYRDTDTGKVVQGYMFPNEFVSNFTMLRKEWR